MRRHVQQVSEIFQTTFGAVRTAMQGFAGPEQERAYARALELSSRTPRERAAFGALWKLWIFFNVRGDLDRALELAERNREIAEACGDRHLRLEAHHALWVTQFFRGEFLTALHHLDEGEPLYDPVADRWSAVVYGQDPKTSALAYRSRVLWEIGRIDQALEWSRRAVEHALALDHPMSAGQALVFAALAHCYRREPVAYRTRAEVAISYAIEHVLPYWMPTSVELRGWSLVQEGELEEGIAEMERGIQLWTAVGAGLARTAQCANLAEALTRAGRLVRAREKIHEGKAIVAATGERYYEPELHRVDAELVLAEGAGAARATTGVRERAERLLHEAMACASRQGARTLELRAATALARLSSDGPAATPASPRLAALLASFTEGFDTADLRDARRLLGH